MPATRTDRRGSQSRARVLLEERRKRLQTLGETIRAARGTQSQTEFGNRISYVRGDETPQTTVSRWEKGTVELTVEQIRDIEEAAGKARGSVLVESGYVDVAAIDVRSLLLADDKVHPDFRADLERVYRSYVEMSDRIRQEEQKLAKRR